MTDTWLFLLWIGWFFLHSFLAAGRVKQAFCKLLFNGNMQSYRIIYNVISLAGLLALLYGQYAIPSAEIFTATIITQLVALLLGVIGLTIMFIAVHNYDWKSFIGISKEKKYSLVVKGINQYVRHPLYSGTMLFVLAFCIWQPYYKNVLLLLLMQAYLAIGIHYEEKKLAAHYGDAYRAYQKTVKKMIPGVW